MTGLSKATISVLIREFQELGIVESAGAGEAQTGPKPQLLRFRRDFKHLIALDYSDVRYEAGLIDLEGNLYGPALIGEITPGEDNLLASMFRAIDTLLDRASKDGLSLGGIGVAVSGLIDHFRGVVHRSTVFGVTNLALQEEIEKRYPLPARIDGDVNVRLVAEKSQDKTDWSHRNVVYFYVGSGVGAGISLDGEIYRGTSGLVGEIGHMVILPGGPQCACGRLGCLEAVASWPTLISRARSRGFASDTAALTADLVAAAAQDGDPKAMQACNDLSDCLGEGLAVLSNILNPDLIVIGGQIARYPDLFYPLLRASLNERALGPVATQVELSFGRVHQHTGLKGIPGLILPVILEEISAPAQP